MRTMFVMRRALLLQKSRLTPGQEVGRALRRGYVPSLVPSLRVLLWVRARTRLSKVGVRPGPGRGWRDLVLLLQDGRKIGERPQAFSRLSEGPAL